MYLRLKMALSLLTAVAFHSAFAVAQLPLKLTYDKPAVQWTEALPLGNGRIGAMVFGGTEDERLQMNESSLWGGGPHDYVAPDSNAHLDEIRGLIFAGKVAEAPPETPFAGRVVTNPSTSPENAYVLSSNGRGARLTYAATMDIELIRELFENCRRGAEVLGVDAEFRSKLDQTEERLPPLQVGKRGQLQEWIEDYAETDPHHRHVSHLYSLYPGHDISLKTTPDLAAAATKTLELRGVGETGWSDVWRIALWARLRNPEQAYANLKVLITTNTLPDMLDLCPPFQIDGNLGGPGAITEMLVQSTESEITVLPALPHQWPAGSLKGVRVRGGGKLDIAWKDGHLTALKLSADHSLTYRVFYGEQSAQVKIQPGKAIVLNGTLHRSGPRDLNR